MAGSRRVARLQARRAVTDSAKAAIATKAAGYIRVSTDEQAARGFGLEVQEKAVRAFAESQGYELVEVVADPGVSGATRPAERPGFAKLIELAAAGAFSVLLVWKFDRLARQIVYAVNAVASSRLASESRCAPSPSRSTRRRRWGARSSRCWPAWPSRNGRPSPSGPGPAGARRQGKGGFAGGGTPYGYRRDLEGGLVVDELEAAIVKRIFELHAGGNRTPRSRARSTRSASTRAARRGATAASATSSTTRNTAATSSISSAGPAPSSSCCQRARARGRHRRGDPQICR
jgi:site-specific DNA recombinase